jgi:adenylate kinase family enzyme
MKKVLVIGCCGAGKSTFSRKLHNIINLELIHLDQYYHKPNWEEPEKEEWEGTVNNLVQKPTWIIDGNYKGTFDIRFKEADTIIYLDYSTIKCFWRVIKRIFSYHGKVRPDMPEGCKERFDLEFLHYVATFNFKNRKGILKRLNAVKEHKKVYVFKTDKKADLFLSELG